MQVLITNNALDNRGGTELYVRDLALSLARRGHTPVAYSTIPGDVAQELQQAGVKVIDNLSELTTPPDIIHGHHHLDTMTALMHFPGVPAILVCHGAKAWQEAGVRFPRIRRYLAVDEPCRSRLMQDLGIAEDQISLLLNFVDLERFKQRPSLPSAPLRALIFSHLADNSTHVPAIRAACNRLGLSLEVKGIASGNVCRAPEKILGTFDLVFAKGRAALEALATGSAVILCDAIGAGPMVTTTNVTALRRLNFGWRALTEPVQTEVITREIERYDPNDAAEVSRLIRRTAGREEVVDELLALYREVLVEQKRNANAELAAEQKAISNYLRDLAGQLKEAEGIKNSPSWQLVNKYWTIKQRVSRLFAR